MDFLYNHSSGISGQVVLRWFLWCFFVCVCLVFMLFLTEKGRWVAGCVGGIPAILNGNLKCYFRFNLSRSPPICLFSIQWNFCYTVALVNTRGFELLSSWHNFHIYTHPS